MSESKSKPEIVLIGGGGHCKSCVDVIESEDKFVIAGIVDSSLGAGTKIFGYTVLGNDSKLPEIRKTINFALLTMGQIKSASVRKNIEKILRDLNFELPVVIASTAYVSKHSTIGRGTIVMHKALLNAAAKIGENCIINTGAIIEHDCEIGNFVHVSTGSIINGNSKINDHCFIGSGTVVKESIKIQSEIIIAAGSLVIKSLEQKGTYSGQPATLKS